MTSRKSHATAAIPLLALLVAILFIALTASSMITTETIDSEEEFEQYLNDTLDEITTYLKIQDAYGKYTTTSPPKLTQIAILLSPLFHNTINISQWIVQIQSTNTLLIQTYNFSSAALGSNTVFDHPIWNDLQINTFGIISIFDHDASLDKYHSFSDTTDQAFLIIKLDENQALSKGEHVIISLTPGTGVKKTIEFKAPLPTKSIVTLI